MPERTAHAGLRALGQPAGRGGTPHLGPQCRARNGAAPPRGQAREGDGRAGNRPVASGGA